MRAFLGQLGLAMLLACGLHAQAMPYRLGIVAIFRNEAKNLREWIEYHRLAGVDHFWLYNHGSIDNWDEVLSPYIEKGIVEVTYFPPEILWPLPAQIDAYKDGIMRAKGRAQWVALIDIDEFLVPMRDKTIPRCLKNHFPKADAIYVNWRNFGTNHVTLSKDESTIFTLTQCSLENHPHNWNGKSIVRPGKVRVADLWYPHHCPLYPGSRYVDGNNKSIPFCGNDLALRGNHCAAFIRINHYILRDDAYFNNVRMANPSADQRALYQQYYVAFAQSKDTKIVKFLSWHRKRCKKIWGINPKRYKTGTRGVVCPSNS